MTSLGKIKKFLKVKLTFKLPNEEKRIAIDPERNPVAPGGAPTWSRIFDTEHQMFFLLIRYIKWFLYKTVLRTFKEQKRDTRHVFKRFGVHF